LVFLRPAIAALQGLAEITQPTIQVRLGRDLPANGARQAYLRAQLERDDRGRFVATPVDNQDSSLVSVLSDADCFVLRAVKAGPALQGEMAEALPFTLSYDGY
jgi:molybdopterin molybdotransferase